MPTSATTNGSSSRPGLKTLDDAFAIRRRILSAFERAEAATDCRRARCLPHLRGDRRRAHRRGARRHAGGDRAAHAGRRIPPHRSAQGARAADRGRPARAGRLHRRAVGQGARAARAPRRRSAHRRSRSPRSAPASSVSAVSASPRAPCSGPPASPPRRSANNLRSPSSTAPAACACSRISRCRRIRRYSSPATSPACSRTASPCRASRPAAKQMGAAWRDNILARIAGRADHAVPLQGLRRARHHRPALGRRATAEAALLRHPRLVVLAGAAHLFPDRIPQPAHRAHQLGLGVFHLRARRAHHPRQRQRARNHGREEKGGA